MKKFVLCVLLLFSSRCFSQSITPDVTSWYLNLTGATGYNSLPANVQSVKYSNDYVYVSCSGIPAYTIGPWPGNPNQASNQNFVFKIARSPQVNSGTKTATPLGHIAVLVNGVALFNPKDAMSYNNQNVWHQNAVVVEGPSMDNCLGHPQQQGEYHHHQNPPCLYTASGSEHSPVIGYAFDGFPIYGAYAFANTDGSGGITRVRTSYRKRNITTRTTLPDGSTASQPGPNVSATYPLGYYVEDFEYVSGLGHLDEYNGRFAVTPEYPEGTYAYYATLDSAGNTEYPYFLGSSFYGVVIAGNTGPGGGHVTISEAVQTFRGVVAYDSSFMLDEDASVSFSLSGQASGGLTMTFAVIDSPNHGTLTGTLPSVTYHPEANYSGTDNFQFTVNAATVWDTGAITLTINAVDDSLLPGQFHVNSEWNIISVPSFVNDYSTSLLFPTATSAAFSFNNGYEQNDTLVNGKGYWVKFDSSQVLSLGDSILTADTINVVAGWNLIGTIGTSVTTSSLETIPPEILSSGFFGYNVGYASSTVLEPGKGYWVKSSQEGQLVITSALRSKALMK
ncbi:MAG: YHYH protein [Ignavibacteriae bacterium]|nr:YHYH protein [Ignavibacteriota bacterium]